MLRDHAVDLTMAVQIAHPAELDRVRRARHRHRVETAADPVRALEELDGPVGALPQRLVGDVGPGSTGADDGEIEHVFSPAPA